MLRVRFIPIDGFVSIPLSIKFGIISHASEGNVRELHQKFPCKFIKLFDSVCVFFRRGCEIKYQVCPLVSFNRFATVFDIFLPFFISQEAKTNLSTFKIFHAWSYFGLFFTNKSNLDHMYVEFTTKFDKRQLTFTNIEQN